MATASASARAVGPPGGGSSEGADRGSACGWCLGGICQIDAKSRTWVAHWNVRALDEEGKAATLVGQLRCYNVMFCGVCDTKLANSGNTEIKDYTLWYSQVQGWTAPARGRHSCQQSDGEARKFQLVDERIDLLRLKFKVCNVTVIEAYAPSEPAEDSRKRFYNKLQEILESLPKHDVLLLLGDFGTQVGTNYDYCGHVLGPHGIGPEVANRVRLLEFCSGNKLILCNTQFQQKNSRNVTWVSPEDQREKIVDFVITREQHATSVQKVRPYWSADIGSNHNLVVADVRVKLLGKRHKNAGRYSNVPKCKVPKTWQYNY